MKEVPTGLLFRFAKERGEKPSETAWCCSKCGQWKEGDPWAMKKFSVLEFGIAPGDRQTIDMATCEECCNEEDKVRFFERRADRRHLSRLWHGLVVSSLTAFLFGRLSESNLRPDLLTPAAIVLGVVLVRWVLIERALSRFKVPDRFQ